MIVSVEGLKKQYGKKLVVDDVAFDLQEGQCLGLIGKNGAGKSTIIKILMGLVFPSSGSIEIFGDKPGKHNNAIGFLSENLSIYPYLNAKDNLRVAALSAGNDLGSNELDDILDKLSIGGNNKKKAESFSLGMKRRLQLGMATMVKQSDLIILDEPTNGLDVDGVLWLRGYLSDLKKQGVSIIIASHSMHELEANITHYLVIDKGKVAHFSVWDKKSKTSLEDQFLKIINRSK